MRRGEAKEEMTGAPWTTTISVAICTHNPDQAVFEQALNAVSCLSWPDGSAPEVVIVDNGSSCVLKDEPYVKAFLSGGSGARVVREERLGLAFARTRAFHEARGTVIVCFDDDNAPDSDYLEGVTQAVEAYPCVGVWGPGKVKVEFQPGCDPDVAARYARYFQEHEQDTATFALDYPLPATIPWGTGMALKKEVALHYSDWYSKGGWQTTGRRGTSLASCDDLQISWLAMQGGWAVGRHPAMRVRHLIPARRAQMSYVARLIYGVSVSYAPALREALPARFNVPLPNASRLALRVMLTALRGAVVSGLRASGIKDYSPSVPIRLAEVLGGSVGAWQAHRQEPPRWVRHITRKFYE